jgi:hypothetical protein
VVRKGLHDLLPFDLFDGRILGLLEVVRIGSSLDLGGDGGLRLDVPYCFGDLRHRFGLRFQGLFLGLGEAFTLLGDGLGGGFLEFPDGFAALGGDLADLGEWSFRLVL